MKKILTFILAIIFAMNIFIVPISAQTQNQNTSTNQEVINEDENNTINQEVQTTTKEDEKKEDSDTNKETEKQSNQETENSEKTQNQNDSASSQNNLTEEKDITNDDPQQFRANGDIPDEFYSTGPMARSANSGFNLKSPYDNKTYTHNSKFKDYNVTYGIDVSYWNGTINWQKVKNDGIKYAFIRVGYRGYGKAGTIDNDSTFKRNITEAKKYGIKVGVYFFSQAITTAEARQEANYTLNKIKGYSIDMPVVIDYEYAGGSDGRLTNANLSKTAATNIVMEFCKTVKNAGYTPMVYANYSMLNNDLNKSTIDSTYKVWLAHYTNSTSYSGKYEFWQHTSSGNVDGISGRVDINVWYTPKESKPTINTPTLSFNGSNENTIWLKWNKIDNATGYVLYRYNTITKKYDEIKEITSGDTTTFADRSKASATTYHYKIKSFYTEKSGKKIYSNLSNIFSATTLPRQVTGLNTTKTATGKINLTWNKTLGAHGYKIFKYNDKTKTYEYLANVNATKYQDTNVSKNNTYYYKVAAYKTLNGKNYHGLTSPPAVSTISSPKLSFNGSNENTIWLKWNKIDNATGYILYRYNTITKKYDTVKEITSGDTTTFADRSRATATTYHYAIKSFYTDKEGTIIYSNLSNVFSATTLPRQVTDLKATTTDTDKITLTWNKTLGAHGYKIFKYNDKTKTYEYLTNVKETTYQDINVSKNNTYYYKIAAYKTLDGKNYHGLTSQILKVQH
ncbi:GH25 family lysozyme [Anaerofustis sp. HA2171]|uniref:GH25 family lysozyme n=1 Tax=Anaerofustis butyriciformans TaxID=3108533 RepID=UPI002E36C1B7|nr:GH25 family lysozyme [Anaerofustis sp. HA2171]